MRHADSMVFGMSACTPVNKADAVMAGAVRINFARRDSGTPPSSH